MKKEQKILLFNEQLGNLIEYKLKGEDAVRDSGIPFCVVRSGALTEEPKGVPLTFDQGDTIMVSSFGYMF